MCVDLIDLSDEFVLLNDSVTSVYEVTESVIQQIAAVLAGKHPVDILTMTFGQHAITGSDVYMLEDVRVTSSYQKWCSVKSLLIFRLNN